MEIFDEEGYIDSEVQEILYELGNVGLGMASITVGRIMGVHMHIGVPKVVPVNEGIILKLYEATDEAKIFMDFQKTISGSMIFIMKREFVNAVVKKMTEETDGCDEAEENSVIQEFVNMLCAAYLKAVGRYTGIRLFVKPSGMQINEKDTIISSAADNTAGNCKMAICVDTGFSIVYENGESMNDVGRVIMLPDEESVKKLTAPLCD